jgi:hypothetical protein
MLWAKRAGKRRYVLGGGVAPGDGVFRYKRAFAPGGLVPFCVARRVHDTALYADLAGTRRRCGERLDPAWSPDPGYFPAYRAQLPRPAARDR